MVPRIAAEPCWKITRREALALGAAAGVTAAAAGVPEGALASSAPVGGTGSEAPGFLRRSSYVDRIGEQFAVGGHVLTLVAVEDVAGAAQTERLRGDETTFSLDFDGPADLLPSALHELHHYELGPFPLFVGPSGPVRGSAQRYNAIVDRSVQVPIGGSPIPQVAAPPEAPRVDGDADSGELPPREVEILDERVQAVQVRRELARRRARRARRRLRRIHADRVTFLRKQRRSARKRARSTRGRWLARHGP